MLFSVFIYLLLTINLLRLVKWHGYFHITNEIWFADSIALWLRMWVFILYILLWMRPASWLCQLLPEWPYSKLISLSLSILTCKMEDLVRFLESLKEIVSRKCLEQWTINIVGSKYWVALSLPEVITRVFNSAKTESPFYVLVTGLGIRDMMVN